MGLYSTIQKKKKTGTSDPLNPKRHPAEIVRRRLADWVRKLGISDDELSPMHAWRHTFKARADRAEISERMSDYITGHAQRTVGAKYGAPTVEDMAAALEKFPRLRDCVGGEEVLHSAAKLGYDQPNLSTGSAGVRRPGRFRIRRSIRNCFLRHSRRCLGR
jgi:hypothetical protein